VELDDHLLQDPPAGNAARPCLITTLAELREVREIGTSRFGTMRLFEKDTSEGVKRYAAKFYNAGDSCTGGPPFSEFLRRFIHMSHPHVLPIAGVIAQTRSQGPIVVTEYSPLGSLADVLRRVHEHDPPSGWGDGMKLRMIVSLVYGLRYLHDNGFVHRELKPTDLIVQENGDIRIDGYLTSHLEEERFIKASHVGGPSYLAPETYDEMDGRKVRNPKTDVFSLGLILYEILFGTKVFPATMSAAVIIRKAGSAKAGDRPVISKHISQLLRDIITKCWASAAAKRPTLETIWNEMHTAHFQLFPGLEMSFTSVLD
jgi:serine/threonine protein kinase